LEPYPVIRLVLRSSGQSEFGFDAAEARLPENLQRRVNGATGEVHDQVSTKPMAAWSARGADHQVRYKNVLSDADCIAIDEDEWARPDAMKANLTHCQEGFSRFRREISSTWGQPI
jgi:hypothetical protein